MLKRAKEEGRSDDTPEAIAKRLDLYDEVTQPVVHHYAPTGKLVVIHGDRSVAEVWAEISDVLERVAA
jgi:adenylate kinase